MAGSADVSLTAGRPYDFEMTGYDASGSPMAVAGRFTSNGDGTINTVFLDVNDTRLQAAR
jgi:hypothetical protein